MTIQKRRASPGRGVSRVNADDARPKPPLDPIPEYEPPKSPKDGGDWLERFEALVDPAFNLSDSAVARIEKQMRLAILSEIAALDSLPEFRVSASSRRGVRRLEVFLVRE